jgi:MFS family permease
LLIGANSIKRSIMALPLNFDILLVLSFGFFLLFTAFNTAQSLSVTVLKDNDFGELGFYSLAVLYMSFGVSSFFAAPIVKRCGERTSLVVASLAYILFTAVFILPALRSENPDRDGWLLSRGFIRTIIILTSILDGVGAGVLWVAQGTTIAKCASD